MIIKTAADVKFVRMAKKDRESLFAQIKEV